jgi:beta-glucanase (GH16 family)
MDFPSEQPMTLRTTKLIKAIIMSAFLTSSLMAIAASTPNGYTLFWSDEFNLGVGKQANPAVWGYDLGSGGWGNGELETYTNSLDNSQIVKDPNATDGLALQIQAIKTATGYTSARLISQGKLNAQYGFIEARIRIPSGQGIWPAFWMLGSNIGKVGWPACGESDIMENVGNVPNTNWGSLHAPKYDRTATYSLSGSSVFNSDYHLFQASWTPNNYTFYVDGVPYHNQNINGNAKWPFNETMFFLLNVAVGGNWPGSPDSTTKFPQNMLVDYVRVYHLASPTSNQVISLFSSANNKFVSAENAGASSLDCNRTTAQGWEQFLVVDLGSNKVALQSQANGKFVTVSSGTVPSLVANATTVTPSAIFQWTSVSNGTAYLKSLANNKYLAIDQTQNPPAVVASASTASGQNAFGITTYGQLPAPNTPNVPGGVSGSAGPSSAKISWKAVPGATSYQIYSSTLPGGAGMAAIGSTSGTAFTQTGLDSTKTYFYSVTAVNSQGMSLRSNLVSVKPGTKGP